MANPEHLQILEQGVEAWNAWRRENGSIRPDLSGANLPGAILPVGNLLEANLPGAILAVRKISAAFSLQVT